MTRIDDKFAALRAEGKKAFVAYVMAGDPDYERSLEVVKGLPAAGVDVIELGLPFTDPMADGPTIQLAGQRALEAGMTLERTLQMVRAFRETDNTTPIVLMGYYNPIYSRGVDTFLADATEAGIDGLIVSNTTLAREGLHGPHASEAGGLSGAPLFERSTRVLARLSQLTQGDMPLIGVGGVASAEQAYEKIRAGAHAVQVYSALVYGGPYLAARINEELADLLEADGFASVADAVGADHR